MKWGAKQKRTKIWRSRIQSQRISLEKMLNIIKTELYKYEEVDLRKFYEGDVRRKSWITKSLAQKIMKEDKSVFLEGDFLRVRKMVTEV